VAEGSRATLPQGAEQKKRSRLTLTSASTEITEREPVDGFLVTPGRPPEVDYFLVEEPATARRSSHWG